MDAELALLMAFMAQQRKRQPAPPPPIPVPPVIEPVPGSPSKNPTPAIIPPDNLGPTSAPFTWDNPAEGLPILLWRLYIVSSQGAVVYDETFANSPIARPRVVHTLTPSTEFYAFVSAVNATGNGQWSDPLIFTTPAA